MNVEGLACTDPAALPLNVAVRILAYAYLFDEEKCLPSLKWYPERYGTHPLRTVAPLVSKRWHFLLRSEEAQRVLWERVYLEDTNFKRGFSTNRFADFWEREPSKLRHMRDLEVSIWHTTADTNEGAMILPLSGALTRLIGSATSLRALRLSGNLPVDDMFASMSSKLSSLQHLSSVYLAGGGALARGDFAAGVRELAKLPSLQQLEIRFSNDNEAVSPALTESIVTLTSLRHLSLQWPLRSAIPPSEDVPYQITALTALTTLKLKRVQLQDPSPSWLTSLSSVLHLYWDPFLPVDLSGGLPKSLGAMTQLQTLYVEMQPPLSIPSTLTSLERLIVVNRAAANTPVSLSDSRLDWMSGMSKLVSLRLQGGRLKEVPETMRRLTGLTRVGLMCNELTAEGLPEGPWLKYLKHIHLGGNCIHEFPKALRSATALCTLHLANQRGGPGSPDGVRVTFMPQHLAFSADDVAALMQMSSLKLVVLGMHQPVVKLGSRQESFEWLQRVLRQRRGRPVRLTSNELAYVLEPLDVFDVRYQDEVELIVDMECSPEASPQRSMG